MKKLRVVMFSTSALAGAPIRIAQAINAHTDIEVRLIDLQRWDIFEHDHVHDENPELSLEIAREADVIHLFNYLDARSKEFYPIDFSALEKSGKKLIRMFESTPMLVAKNMGIPLDEVLYDPIPQLVIAQYPERFYPRARVVPNIIPQNQNNYLPESVENKWSVTFTPSWQRSAWDARWDTKGVPETLAMMKRVSRHAKLPVKVISGRPFPEVMQAKRESSLVIDELVTGSYHLSGLEGLSLGKPTLGYVDARTQRVLRWISGSQTCPFVSVRMEDAEHVIRYLLDNDVEREEIGQQGREWIEHYWNDKCLVKHYEDVYEKLMDNPENICRQPDLTLSTSRDKFFAITLPDQIYYSRKRRGIKERGFFVRCKDTILDCLRSVKKRYFS